MFGIQEGSYALCTAIDYFCYEFENMLFAAFGVAPAAQGLGETRSAAKDLLRNTVSAIMPNIRRSPSRGTTGLTAAMNISRASCSAV